MPLRPNSVDRSLFSSESDQDAPLSTPSPAPVHLPDVEQIDTTLGVTHTAPNSLSTQNEVQHSIGDALLNLWYSQSTDSIVTPSPAPVHQLTEDDDPVMSDFTPRTPNQPVVVTFPEAPSRPVTHLSRDSEHLSLPLSFTGWIDRDAGIAQADDSSSDDGSPAPREPVAFARNRDAQSSEATRINPAIIALSRVRRHLNIPQPQPIPVPVELAPGRPAGLNGTQINILDGTIDFPISSILELENIEHRIHVFNCILADILTEQQSSDLTSLNILEEVNEIRRILEHPYPQNRRINYPYYDPPRDSNIVIFQVRYSDGVDRPGTEQRGLLGLTARCDSTFAPPSREHVVAHIRMRINQQIEICERELAERRAVGLGR